MLQGSPHSQQDHRPGHHNLLLRRHNGIQDAAAASSAAAAASEVSAQELSVPILSPPDNAFEEQGDSEVPILESHVRY